MQQLSSFRWEPMSGWTNQKERQRLLDLKLSEGEEKSYKCSALSAARFLQSEDWTKVMSN